ncbi:isopenicillin N synthase family dioxygenase [Acinetobacter sp. HY1485]|uniref:isopenicillin N synthase family dioxygenase n=1 Tax=Acinetobacter sp. HY1485 TaxID=2970918 RepID=UPI0022B9825A|nr:2-oxoglutarate and iron-dependent oxygenase domain-containing protein [Acinetobacter sp. HY1485]
MSTVPILDLSAFDDLKKQPEFLAHLKHTARHIGFFYLTGHGISAQRFEEIQRVSKAFFAQDQAEKDRILIDHSPHFRGYTRLNTEITRNHPDFREQIDLGPELPVNTEQYPLWKRLQGPNQWPAVPQFRSIVEAWQKDLRVIAIKLLHAFLLALDLPKNALDRFVTGTPNESLKIIHYPNNQQHTQGVGAHKDTDILTLLLQDRVGGLQVKHQNEWIDVPFVENAFVVNIGEILELATNGYLVANVHQVVSPKKQTDRYSIAYFLAPTLDAGEVPILKLAPHLQALAQGPQSDPLNPLLKNVGENGMKSRLRSHLAVTQRFYPEYAQGQIK